MLTKICVFSSLWERKVLTHSFKALFWRQNPPCINVTFKAKHTSCCRGQQVLQCCHACCWRHSVWVAVQKKYCWPAEAAGQPELPASAPPEPWELLQLSVRDKCRYFRYLHQFTYVSNVTTHCRWITCSNKQKLSNIVCNFIPLTSCSLSLFTRSAAGSLRLNGARRRLSMLSSALARSSSSLSSCWARAVTLGSSEGEDTGAEWRHRKCYWFFLSDCSPKIKVKNYLCNWL